VTGRLTALLSDPAALSAAAAGARTQAVVDAAAALADLVEQHARQEVRS
jgi:hypothetical protein